jgi:hypothetical protein
MAKKFTIRMEDATRYLPHDPRGRAYQHFVFSGTERNVFSGEEQPRLVFSGTRDECENFVRRMTEK